jgi:hypothetical protein
MNGAGVLCASVLARPIFMPSYMAGCFDMKFHLSAPSSHSLLLLATILVGWSTGVLWPVNGFLLKFFIGFIETLVAILIVASVVWCATTFYMFACRPFFKFFKFQKKLTLVQSSATRDDMAPIITASAPLDETTAGKWIGVGVLTSVVALWSLLLGWAISTAESQFVMFAGWSAVGCSAVGFGLCVIAGAFDSDDVGTLALLALTGAAIFTTLVLAALFASIT